MEQSDDEDEFLFESAHLALRANTDYMKVIRHLTHLCALRIKVHNDIEVLSAVQQRALADPLSFVNVLTNGELNLPGPMEVPEIPLIDLSKYNVNLSKISNNQDADLEPSATLEKQPQVNFWTLDEQRKLEELLNEFPPEPIESQRFKKIAKAMGNRTPKQIASRVQKFFKKLQEENLPIPGSSSSRSLKKKRHRQNLKLERPSTFFPERNIPSDLIMREDSEEDSCTAPAFAVPDNDDPKGCKNERILLFLKQIRTVKEKISSNPTQPSCSDETCSSCSDVLLNGCNWFCVDCDRVKSNVFCSDCFTSQLLKGSFPHLYHDMRNF